MIPLTTTFVTEMFGDGAFQIPAGESFVICNPSESRVYKLPFLEGKSIVHMQRKWIKKVQTL